MEEYDLLCELKEKVKNAELKGVTSSEWYQAAAELIKVPEEIAPDKYRGVTEPSRMDYWRERLFKLLETAPK